MEQAPVELWLRGRGSEAPPPECLVGVPLLQAPGVVGLYRLVTSSVWTPLTWGDIVNVIDADEEALIVSLAASGRHTRTAITYDEAFPRIRARAVAHEWGSRGAKAIESLPGLFIVAWVEGMDAAQIREVLNQTTHGLRGWDVIEEWTAAERTPEAIADFLA